MEPVAGVSAVPDPVNDQMATVLQLSPLAVPSPKAAPTADGLWFAGQLLAKAARGGGLSRDYVLRWLGAVDSEERIELMRRVMTLPCDPASQYLGSLLAVVDPDCPPSHLGDE